MGPSKETNVSMFACLYNCAKKWLGEEGWLIGGLGGGVLIMVQIWRGVTIPIHLGGL